MQAMSKKPQDFRANCYVPSPEDTEDPQDHTPIQKRNLEKPQTLQDLGKLNPQDDNES